MNIVLIAQLLLLLLVANGAPILARKVFGARFYQPIDRGYCLGDGLPLFGVSKTWRGIVASIVLTMLVCSLLDMPAWQGVLISVLAMAGDLLSSFIKRRLGLAASSRALGLDQIPESLLPVLGVAGPLSLSWLDIFIVILLFFLSGIVLSKLLYIIGLRKQPH